MGKKQYKLLELQQNDIPVFNIIDLDNVLHRMEYTNSYYRKRGRCGMKLTLNEEFNLSNLIFQKGYNKRRKVYSLSIYITKFQCSKGDFNIVSTGLKVLTDLDYS